MPSFGLSDIKRTIPRAAFARAERYVRQGRVRGVGPGEEADSLIGHVQGTERQPYEQQIRIIGEGRDRRIIGWCSCPVGANCKHVGAVLLTASGKDVMVWDNSLSDFGWIAVEQMGEGWPHPDAI